MGQPEQAHSATQKNQNEREVKKKKNERDRMESKLERIEKKRNGEIRYDAPPYTFLTPPFLRD